MRIIAEKVVQAATDLVDTVSAEKTLLAHKFSANPPKVLGEKELVIYTLALSFSGQKKSDRIIAGSK